MKNDFYIKKRLDEGTLMVNTKLGTVYSSTANDPLRPLGAKTKKGYLRTTFHNKGKLVSVMIHRIIWIKAHGIPADKMEVNHKDGNKLNNSIDNLELVTMPENMKHAAKMGLSKGGWKDGKRNKKGQYLPKKHSGRLLDGVEWNGMPEVVK